MRATLQQLNHDLRQPLSIIESSAYCLALLTEGDACAHAHLERIREQVALASRMLDAIALYEAPQASLDRTNSTIAGVTY